MAKEYLWNIRVNGIRHEVLARDQGNSFDIYVDEEFRFNIPVNPNLDIAHDYKSHRMHLNSSLDSQNSSA